MKIQRTLAPTAAPIPFQNLVRAPLGVLGGRSYRDRLIRELKEQFSAHGVFLVTSGKAALTILLKALAARSTRRRVVIPAYTCFSVPSAIVKAGLDVVLCDVEPDTLDFRFEELEAMLDEHVLCVLPTHLFGLAADVSRVKRLCREKGIAVVRCRASDGRAIHNRPDRHNRGRGILQPRSRKKSDSRKRRSHTQSFTRSHRID
jgi:hypothetical protein